MTDWIDAEEVRTIFKRLKNPANDRCIECEKKNTQWASVHLGIYICMDCSGKHRSFGPVYSLVRSLTMDNWNQRYVLFMENGGNQKFWDYMKKQGEITGNNCKNLSWENNNNIKKYKAQLTSLVDILEQRQKKSDFSEEQNDKQQIQQQSKKAGLSEQEQEQQQQEKEEEQARIQKEREEQQKKKELNNNLANFDSGKVKTSNVVFASKKSNQTTGNKKIKAEKIDDFDWDQLNFDDGSNKKEETKKKNNNNNDFKLYEEEEQDKKESSDPFAMNGNAKSSQKSGGSGFMVNDFQSKQSNNNSNGSSQDNTKQFDKFKQQNAKSISSSSFFTEPTSQADKQKFNQFNGSGAISSDMYFDRETNDNQDQGQENIEKLKDFFWNVKGKTTDLLGKVKENWK